MTAIITCAQLFKAGACAGQLALFISKFGKSVEVTVGLAESVAGEFDWSWAAANLLTEAAQAEYKRVTAPALAEYGRVTAAAWPECERVEATARAEYERVTAPAFATAYINQGGAA